MNVTEALELLSNINRSGEEIRLLIDCPHCGRAGELGSLRPTVMAAPATFRSDLAHEQASHDAELRRISTALGLGGRTSIEAIIEAIRERPPKP